MFPTIYPLVRINDTEDGWIDGWMDYTTKINEITNKDSLMTLGALMSEAFIDNIIYMLKYLKSVLYLFISFFFH